MLSRLIKLLPSRPVYAHCDIPCGIYDPTPAQIAAHTVLRMTQLIKKVGEEMEKEDEDHEDWLKMKHDVARMTQVKEAHAEIVKHEITVIWGDYFKEENSKDTPDLADKVWKILKLASKAKQNIDETAASDLLSAVQEFAEIFWKSKNIEPVRIPSGYPTEGEMVVHK